MKLTLALALLVFLLVATALARQPAFAGSDHPLPVPAEWACEDADGDEKCDSPPED